MKTHLKTFDLTTRTFNILAQKDIIYLEDLLLLSIQDLFKWKTMTMRSINEIISFLESKNLCLKDDEIDPSISKLLLKEIPNILLVLQSKIVDVEHQLKYLQYKLDKTIRLTLKK